MPDETAPSNRGVLLRRMATSDDRRLDEEIHVHIFAVSAQLVGVSLTALGVLRFFARVHGQVTVVELMLMTATLAFLVTCVSNFAMLKIRRRLGWLRWLAEGPFIAGLLILALAALEATLAIV